MLVKISSKGQLVVPKEIRRELNIGPGTILKVSQKDNKIILEPFATSMVERLHGKFEGENLLSELEREHRQELRRESRS